MRRVILLVGLAGCEQQATKPAEPSASAAVEASASATASVSAAPRAPELTKKDALAVLEALFKAADAQGLDTSTGAKLFDEENDPNELLGRPGQYIVKYSWKLKGDDATVEFFRSHEDAERRRQYIDKIHKASPMFLDYMHLHPTKHALLRVPKGLTPTEAKKWEGILLSL